VVALAAEDAQRAGGQEDDVPDEDDRDTEAALVQAVIVLRARAGRRNSLKWR